MAFLFPQKKPKSLAEIVFALNECILRTGDVQHPHKPLSGGPNSSTLASLKPGGSALFSGSADHETQTEQQKQASEESGRLLSQIRQATWARSVDNTMQPADPEQLAGFAKEVYSTGVLVPLLQNLKVLDFDARRDVASFFTFMLKRQPTVDYLLNKVPEIFTILMAGAGDVEIHHTVCQILRECARHEAIVTYMMGLQNFWLFFQYVDHYEFEVATDNFSTFQDYLRNFPDLTSKFILQNTDYFTKCINGLISSKNYVARRQSLRLLFQIIKQSRNHQYLLEYVSGTESLKLIMLMLRDKSKNIHYEAFQIFKCFVVNPNKPKPIIDILVRNRQKLIEMLEKPHTLADRRDDQLYQNERAYVKEKLMAFPVKQPNPAPKQPDSHNVPNSGVAHQQHHHQHHNHHGHNHDQKLHQPHHHGNQDLKYSSPTRPGQYVMQPPVVSSSHNLHPMGSGIPFRSPSKAQAQPALMNVQSAAPVLSQVQSTTPEN